MENKGKTKKSKKVYIIEITLLESKPRIWRKIAVSPDIKLDEFHMIIQKVMGWTNSHLHTFRDNSQIEYSRIYPHTDDALEFEDERKYKLSDILDEDDVCASYEYDFGDYWCHDIKLIAIEDADENVKYPICIDGAMACPPEDCGGVDGYKDMLKALKGRNTRQKKEYIEWLGGDFDPNEFDIKDAQSRLEQNWEEFDF